MSEIRLPTVAELVEQFEKVPLPSDGTPVNLEAAEALAEWKRHPHVCSGGMLSDTYVPVYLEALAAELRKVRFWLAWASKYAPETATLSGRPSRSQQIDAYVSAILPTIDRDNPIRL